jgi:adenylosuccinate synthase
MAEIFRGNSYAIGGGYYGDEGKGKFTDYFANEFFKKGIPLTVFRVNGGANAGHTLEFDGKRVALHQLPCGLFVDNTTVVLGNDMVLHPTGLVEEIDKAKEISNNKLSSSIKISLHAGLALDTHRAYESATGKNGSTGRGIGPSNSNINLNKFVVNVKDFVNGDWEKFGKHYDFYKDQIAGLGQDLSSIKVATLDNSKIEVGNKDEFINRLKEARERLLPFIQDVQPYIRSTWNNENHAYIFEMAQAIGLDPKYGLYPDVTSADTTFNAINTSTEGLVNYREVEHRISTIKTYISSVGVRVLPTLMPVEKATRIRNDNNEFGASTGRSRDIACLDLPTLRFFNNVGGANEIGITHMDSVYPNEPIRICTDYQIDGQSVEYRPYQEWADQVTPIYTEVPTWDKNRISLAKILEKYLKKPKILLLLLKKDQVFLLLF